MQALEWFRVMWPLGAFVLVFLEAQIKSTCISHNSFCIFPIQQCIITQLLNSVFCDICNNQGLGKGNQLPPCLFRISQKPHPSIVYKQKCNIFKSVSMGKPGRTRQEVIQLKSPILLKLGINVGFGE